MQKTVNLFLLLAAISTLPTGGYAQQAVRWEATLENAQRLAGQTNRLVLIHFWAPWCGVCERMEVEVLTEPSVSAELASNYVAVKINADHFPATATQYGVTALPTTVITTPQGKMLDSMRGRVEAPEYKGRLQQVAATFKQRAGAVYAQMPTGSARSAAAPAAPARGPSAANVPASMVSQSPAATNGPALGATAQPATARAPDRNGTGLSDDRYADFFRGSQSTSVAPIAQPSPASPAIAANQPSPPSMPPNRAMPYPASPASPPAMMQQTNRPVMTAALPSQPVGQTAMPAPGGAAYGARAPQAPVDQIAAQRPANPSVGSMASPVLQSPSINPPLGLDGYCPVALTERQQWVSGDRRWGAIHRGRTYLFSGAEEQRRFFTDPDRYSPAISGNDIVLAAEQGQAAPGMREHGVFFGNRVYLFSSEATLEKFGRNPAAYANQAMGAGRPGVNGAAPSVQ